MELSDDGWEWMGSGRGTEEIVGFMEGGGPITEGFIHRVLKSSGSGVDGDDLRSHQLHTEYVWLLSGHIFRTHVDHTLEIQQCARKCSSGAVLARSGLRNNACLPHPLCQQCLTKNLVRLVCSTVYEVFPLEEDARFTPEVPRLCNWCGTAEIVTQ